jgi:hypothetical protein
MLLVKVAKFMKLTMESGRLDALKRPFFRHGKLTTNFFDSRWHQALNRMRCGQSWLWNLESRFYARF